MQFSIQREDLLKPLQLVVGVVERKQTMPVLSNVLFVIENQQLSLTGSDSEVELVGRVTLSEAADDGEITIPARKLMDICKNLPAEALINFRQEDQKMVISSGRSRFTLITLPASDFPQTNEQEDSFSFELPQGNLRYIIERTSFAMAQQDVRYYLNGLLLEAGPGRLRAVATDGHRLALCDTEAAIENDTPHQVIVPRKGVLELARLMSDESASVKISLGANYIRAAGDDFTFTSKLVDGKFPDYDRVLPRGGDKLVTAQRQQLREALNRASILSNEKYRGIRLQFDQNLLSAQANNPEQEAAEEEITIDYNNSPLDIGFNVSYLLDVLSVMTSSEIRMTLSDSNSSALLQEGDNSNSSYVVMPMRL